MKLLLTLVFVFAYTVKIDGIISNNNPGTSDKFPYLVSLRVEYASGSTAVCGGSLIAPNWVLTAAQCVYNKVKVAVRLGSNNNNSGGLFYTIPKFNIFIHHEYIKNELSNDIALIKIPTTEYTNLIKPIILPSITAPYKSYEGALTIAAGWGRTTDTFSPPNELLHYGMMEIVSNTVCEATYGPNKIFPTNICLRTQTHVSPCYGDFGGPLILLGTNKLVGVISFGSAKGCEVGEPFVITRVTSYLNWIKQVTGVSY